MSVLLFPHTKAECDKHKHKLGQPGENCVMFWESGEVGASGQRQFLRFG